LKEDANGVVTIPADWTDIPERAFRKCTDLKKVVIPAEITEIKNRAFDLSRLEVIEFEDKSQLIKIGGWCIL